MTIEETVRKVLGEYSAGDGYVNEKAFAVDLAERIARYGEAMHDRGNSHRVPWGYVPEDRQVKALNAALAAFQGGGR